VARPILHIFLHRMNPDGSFDLICRVCFKTVAANSNERDLEKFQEAHDCDGFNLSQLMHPLNA
jgi:hypothetical protein